MTHTITIKPNELEAIHLAASKEQVRFYLNGVFFELYEGTNNFAMVATDGHRLHSLNVQSVSAPLDSFILSSDDIKKALAMVKLHKNKHYSGIIRITKQEDDSLLVEICIEGGGAIAALSSFTTKPIDHSFVDFRRVIPRAPDTVESNMTSFNTDFMADFGRAAKLLNGNKTGHLQTIITTPESPILINIQNQPTFTGVLMPVRW